MDAKALGGDSSDSSSSASSSSSDTVLIAKPLNQKHRKQLQAQLRAEDSASERAAAAAHKHADLLCLVCERDGGADVLLCSGPCVSAFHAACLGVDAPPPTAAAAWKCPSCTNNTHACFHCKKAGANVGTGDETAGSAEGLRPVRKCRALSCGKFYHSDCIAKLPLARIAGSHFICPLHTCAACEQSGAKKESVRCMRCPVAYHTSCLPKNCARNFPGKRIICPKHERDAASAEEAPLPTSSAAAAAAAAAATAAADLSPGKEKTSVKKQQSLKTTESESVERGEHTTGDSPSAIEETKVKTENRSDSKAETREASSSSKKLSKSAKREKKKKKKKRKKASKRDAKEGRSDHHDDDDDDDDDEDADEASDAKRVHVKTEGSDGDAADEQESNALTEGLSILKREDSFTLPALSITHVDAVSPATSSSLYESPSTANERIKARLVEALGHSDDDVESLGSPITLPTPKAVEATSDDAPSANVVEQAEAAPICAEDPEKVKQERISEGEEGDDEEPPGASSPTLRRRTSSGTPRGGDTADGAKSKASSSSRPSKKKKKKTKALSSHPVDVAQDTTGGAHSGLVEQDDSTLLEEKDDANEAKWVQCDRCKKWRTVSKDIDLDAMPERWYCEMNTWDVTFASCSVDEEGVDPAVKKQKSGGSHSKKSKGKAKSKAQPESAAPLTIVAADGGASSPSSGPGTKTPVAEAAEDTASGDKSAFHKKQDKQSKKRKLKLKLKEKYREVKWVQCENAQCGKWRVVPSSIDFSLLPAVWFCNLNTWAPEIAKCSAPNPPEVETFLMKSHSKKGASSASGSSSRPSKKAKSSGEATVLTPDGAAAAAVLSGGMAFAGASGDVPAKPPKPAKTPKGGVNLPVSSNVQSAVATSATDSSTGGGAGGGNSTTGGSSTTNAVTDHPPSSSSALAGGKSRKAVKPDGIKKTVLEWAQCEKCNKWRKLPQHIKSSTLPDKWFCSMNHWDPVRASCSVPEEADQEPLGASPLPSSQNYYPMPGHFGTNANGVRSKRSKLSYSDLLYAGTGQLRKTYTSESSTLTFEHGGRIYHRDDQYKDSSMYVSPQDALASTKADTLSASGSGTSTTETADVAAVSEKALFASIVTAPNEPSVEHVATLVLDSMDLRRTSTIAELFRAANTVAEAKASQGVSLSLVTAAVCHLMQKGLIEKQESEGETDTETERTSSATRVGSKRRRLPSDVLFSSANSAVLQFRKVPKRPLKASKCWKLGQAAFEFPLKD